MDKNVFISDVKTSINHQMDQWRLLCTDAKEIAQRNRIRITNYVEQLLDKIDTRRLIEAAYLSDDNSLHHVLQQMARENQRTRVAALCSENVQKFNTQIESEDANLFDLRQTLEPQIHALQHKYKELVRPYPILETHLQDILDIAEFAAKNNMELRHISYAEGLFTKWVQKKEIKNQLREKVQAFERIGVDSDALKAMYPIAKEIVNVKQQLTGIYAEQIEKEKAIFSIKQELIVQRDKTIQEANLAKSEDTIFDQTRNQIKALLIQYPKKWIGRENSWVPERIQYIEKDCLDGLAKFEKIEQQQVRRLEAVHLLKDWLEYVNAQDIDQAPQYLLEHFDQTRSRPMLQAEKELIMKTHEEWFGQSNTVSKHAVSNEVSEHAMFAT